jgi:hypothetical protein
MSLAGKVVNMTDGDVGDNKGREQSGDDIP